MRTFAREFLFKHRIIAGLFLIVLFLFSHTSKILAEKPADQKKKVLTKSLIYPGLGQLYEKQYVKGWLFLTAETVCVIAAIINNHQGNKYYDRYREASISEDAVTWREKTETYDKRRNLFILTGVAVWVVNMIDIYIYTKKKYKKGVSLYIRQNAGNSIYFGIRLTF